MGSATHPSSTAYSSPVTAHNKCHSMQAEKAEITSESDYTTANLLPLPLLPHHQTYKIGKKTTAVRMHLTMQQLVISLVCLTVASSSLGKSTDLSDYQQVRCLLFNIYRHKF